MAFSFGDGFDCYAAPADGVNGYWDNTTNTNCTFVAGRFSGSQACRWASTISTVWTKTSGVNDAVHHIVCAFQQTATITGSTLGLYLQLLDGTTAQCSIVFRSDGAILLTSGGPAGTVLATYTGAFPVVSTWYAFEFEVVVNNTTGSFTVRKNGNTSADFTLGSLNTRGGTANNYANKLTISMNASVSAQLLDDLFWRSDASSVAFLGDIRCYTRMPASDASVQFSRSGSGGNTQTITGGGTNSSITNTNVYYAQFTPTFSGSIGTATIVATAGNSGNVKCSIFDANGPSGGPGAVLGSATVLTPIATGTNTLTFSTPVSVARNVPIWLGVISDTSTGTWGKSSSSFTQAQSTTTYAAFPVASPTLSSGPSSGSTLNCSITINANTNNAMVAEPQQDGATSYVYDSTPGDADFYTIGSIASTPVTTIAVVTRGYMQKSDAGTRTAAVQLKSGGTTVASPTLVLTTSGWLWAWRMDLTDPATSAAWTAAAVNNVTIGPTTIA